MVQTCDRYDPVAKAEAMKLLPEIMYADDEYAAVKGADALGLHYRMEPVSRSRHDTHSRLDDDSKDCRSAKYL